MDGLVSYRIVLVFNVTELVSIITEIQLNIIISVSHFLMLGNSIFVNANYYYEIIYHIPRDLILSIGLPMFVQIKIMVAYRGKHTL